jgi:hypothetical protein
MGWMIEVQFLAGAGNFSLQHHFQTNFGAHPASYPKGTRKPPQGIHVLLWWGHFENVVDFRVNRNEDFLAQLNNYQLLEEDPILWS